MLYAGWSKVVNPEWTAGGFLKGAKTFTGLYTWFGQPGVLPAVDFLNEWGLTLLGVSLILGVFVRFSSTLGVLLMLLYYFPGLDFPKAGSNGFIVDDHIVYALLLAYFAVVKVGRQYGLDGKWASTDFYKKWKFLG